MKLRSNLNTAAVVRAMQSRGDAQRRLGYLPGVFGLRPSVNRSE
jgi:hypothetical protein